jgi:hypothetical protein
MTILDEEIIVQNELKIDGNTIEKLRGNRSPAHSVPRLLGKTINMDSRNEMRKIAHIVSVGLNKVFLFAFHKPFLRLTMHREELFIRVQSMIL